MGDTGVRVSYPFSFEVNHINTLSVGLSHPILYVCFMAVQSRLCVLGLLKRKSLKIVSALLQIKTYYISHLKIRYSVREINYFGLA